jgi:hypothetical protein
MLELVQDSGASVDAIVYDHSPSNLSLINFQSWWATDCDNSFELSYRGPTAHVMSQQQEQIFASLLRVDIILLDDESTKNVPSTVTSHQKGSVSRLVSSNSTNSYQNNWRVSFNLTNVGRYQIRISKSVDRFIAHMRKFTTNLSKNQRQRRERERERERTGST